MKLTILFLVTFILQVSAKTYAQKITLSENNAPLDRIFKNISDQTGYDFLISTANLKLAKPVTIHLTDEELKPALNKIFAGQPLSFVIQEKMVVVSKKETILGNQTKGVSINPITITGKISDTTGLMLPGASIKNTNSNKSVLSDQIGAFTIQANPGDEIEITFLGYEKYKFSVGSTAASLIIVLKLSYSKLNEIQVIGYGTTTRRLNTGSVSAISAKEIEEQPVTNVVSTLSGRLPGVFVQTLNGLPGGNINIQIRGQNSLRNTADNNGNYPLYIIDGVPYPAVPLNPSNRLAAGSVNGAQSPLNSIAPADIESISILKDADATAIYGSRGANGVVLITTKQGKTGSAKISINFSEGLSRVSSLPSMLGLADYLTVRREAFKNDGRTPSADPVSADYAPDLKVWSQTISTNWPKYVLGGTASSSDLQGSVSGGGISDKYLLSGSFHREGAVLPGENHYQRAGLHYSFNHRSLDEKFSLNFTGSYTSDNNRLANPVTNLKTDVLLAPNFDPHDSAGNLNWSNNVNPLADIRSSSLTQSTNFVSNLFLSYHLSKDLNLKTSFGYNRLNSQQTETFPFAAQNPAYGVSNANFGHNGQQAIILEPQFSYNRDFGGGVLDVLVGGTWQRSEREGELITATNFSNDALIKNAGSAATYSVSNSDAVYRYVSIFGRINYILKEKYIINASARRDGSSRFGPGKQFGNFGAIGAAWIFTDYVPLLSFGKLRSSYGITGNDQITDYQYLSTYSSGAIYQGVPGLQATQVANADLRWETNIKAEVALELGFTKDRIRLNVAYFRNKSGNQLINYTLPLLSGFASYQANLPALVQNTGWEVELSTINIAGKSWGWSSNFNLTLPKNRLLEFPGLATSSYANSLGIGQDINQPLGYIFTGVDPSNGKAQYVLNAAGTAPATLKWGQASPYFYGGFGNTVRFKDWALDIFASFAKQMMRGGTTYSPGLTPQNEFSNILGRWQHAGDITAVPKASLTYDPYYDSSTANWYNGTYLRLKNVSLSRKIKRGKIYIQGQNLLTVWHQTSALYDPETGIGIPPLRTIILGFNFNF